MADDIAALGPDRLEQLRVSAPKTSATGFPAVASSLAHAWSVAGLGRGTRALLMLNQVGGVDCPSCAWPDPDDHRETAEFCENGAKAIAWEADSRKLTPEFFAVHSIEELADQTDYWHGQQGRLTEPMLLKPGSKHYEPIAWDNAFQLIATELNALPDPNEAAFYTSGRTSNEAAFLYQLFVRQFGTNNLPDCSNMCHESSSVALPESIGIGKGTVKLDDFPKAEVILIFGQNPGTNHPRMLTALQNAKRAGAQIVAINPLREAGLLAFNNPQEIRGMLGFATPLADRYLQVRIGGDQALLQGIQKELLLKNAVDQTFVAVNTDGFPELESSLANTTWEHIEAISGIARAEIASLAELLGQSERIIICWAMGLTQHKYAVATIQDLVNVLLLRGSLGKPGAGVCPVRGHSNVQGDRTMGINEGASDAFLNALEKEFGYSGPRPHGFNTVDTIRALRDGRVKVFFALGGNFLSATPDTNATAEGLRRARLTVHVSIKLNRSHLVTGRTALILPCLGRSERDAQAGGEQFVTTENSMGIVQRSLGKLEPASPKLLSEPAIVAKLATAVLGRRSTVPWDELIADYDRIRTRIERVIPGFERFNERVRQPGGFYLPNKPRYGEYPTATGRARFHSHPLLFPDVQPGELILMTIRTHDQFNTTVYGMHDRYRGIHGERRVILMNAADLTERGLQAGDRLDLTGHFNGEARHAPRFVAVAYDIPRGCAAAYFPETNVLVPLDSTADRSQTPTSKFIRITVGKRREELS